jgi:hypothetical protein
MAKHQHNSESQIHSEPSDEPCVESILPNILITKEQVDIFIERIENEIKIKKNKSDTQGNSKKHEKDVLKILIEIFDCQLFDKKLFNEFITKMINKQLNYPSKFKIECPKYNNKILNKFIEENDLDIKKTKSGNVYKKTKIILDIIKDNEEQMIEFNKLSNCGMVENKLYIVEQPFGPQSYPDFILFYINDGYFHLRYIECKQLYPNWNNSPPKNNRNCIYICGNKVYCGDCITNKEEILMDKEYSKKYDELAKEYTELAKQKNLNKKYVAYKIMDNIKFPPEYFNQEINNHNIILSLISI